MTLKEKLKAWPREEWPKTQGLIVDCIYIVITNRKHDSGYKIYESYGSNNDGSYSKMIGCHDVIDFVNCEGAYYGYYSIAIDSIEKGMFRIFNHNGSLKIIHSLSSLVIMPVKEVEE